MAYERVSRIIADRLGADPDTHRELIEAAERAGLDDDTLDALQRLTVLYEQAAYAPGPVGAADAKWVVQVATHLEELVQ